jgi:HEAT repeat protein
MTDTLQIDAKVLTWEESIEILNNIPQLPLNDRAREVCKLFRNPSPGIRQRALNIGAAVLTDDQLVDFIRNGADDVIRNAGLEILKLRGARTFPLSIHLLSDRDPDVVLQAIILLDHLRDPRAYNYLRPFLSNPNPNLVQVTITAIGHLGSARAVHDLLLFLKAGPWLQMTAIQALGDIRSSQAIKPLQELLTDLFLSSLAAEAIARIGGSKAFSVLAEHWMRFRENLEAESMLELLAHVLEGLKKKPVVPKDFLRTIYSYLSHDLEKVRLAAARCVLICGPCNGDQEALLILAHSESSEELPACIQVRADLVPSLVKMKGLPRIWGLQLVSLSPKDGHLNEIITVLESEEALTHLEVVIRCMQKIEKRRMQIVKAQTSDKRLAKAIFKLYVRLPIPERALLISLIKMFRNDLKYLLNLWPDIDKEISLVLKSLLGENARNIARSITEMPTDSRISVLSQIRNKSVYRNLPWEKWLTEEPIIYGPVAAQIAANTKMTELLPLLRNVLPNTLHPDIIRCFGEFQDRESIATLMNCYSRSPQLFQVLILDTLGEIGGPEARKVLCEEISNHHEKLQSVAYRALSHCAVDDDLTMFREAVAHPNWMVRLACVEVFGRFLNTENIDYLTRLASDPVNVVSQRAHELIEA